MNQFISVYVNSLFLTMLREHFVAILSFILLNALMISCVPSGPTIKPKELSQDGHLAAKRNQSDMGPLSPKILEQRPLLLGLGSFNGKYWFIERTFSTFSQARYGCESAGMILAEAGQAELNFLYDVTYSDEDISWLGANIPLSSSVFRWFSGDVVQPNIPFRYYNNLGLTLDRWSGNSGVYSLPDTSTQYYICTIYL